MTLSVEAIYENGTLKLDHPLPLKEHEKVHLTVRTSTDIQAALDAVERSYGVLGWTGDPEIVRRVARDDEVSILESP